MAAVKSPKAVVGGLWADYAPWLLLMLGAYIIFSFRKVFSSLGDAAGDTVAGAVATTQAAAAVKVAQTKVQAATGNTKVTHTPAQLAKFEADARTLAGYLGQLPGIGNMRLFKNQKDAFGMIKGTYSRLNLYNNKPWSKVVDKKQPKGYRLVSETKETKTSQKNIDNYHVLVPFYKDITEGRDLVNDFREYVTDSAYTRYFSWIL